MSGIGIMARRLVQNKNVVLEIRQELVQAPSAHSGTVDSS